MKVLINVNEQITATIIEMYFQASGLDAEITAVPNDRMLETSQLGIFDLIAFYADEIDNTALISVFEEAGNIRKIMFVKKHNVALIAEELESMLDECFTIPLDSGGLMIRLRRMFRDTEQKSANPIIPTQQPKPAEPVQPQPAPYIPPVQNIEPFPAAAMPVIPEPPAQGQSNPEPMLTPADEEFFIAPVKTDYSYTPESFRQQSPAQPDLPSAAVPVQREEMAGNGVEPEAALEAESPADLLQGMPVQTIDSAAAVKTGQKSLFVKIFSVVSKVFFILLIFLVAVLAVFLIKSKISGGTPSVFGYQIYGVLSGSMNGSDKTSFDTGSMVLVKTKDVNKIVEGDIITFRGLSAEAPMTTHRVVKVNNSDGNLTFTTRGDANNVDDPKPIQAEKVVGTVRGHIPYLGYLTGFAETKTGLIFLVFIPGALVIFYELFNIYRTLKNERKKGKKA